MESTKPNHARIDRPRVISEMMYSIDLHLVWLWMQNVAFVLHSAYSDLLHFVILFARCVDCEVHMPLCATLAGFMLSWLRYKQSLVVEDAHWRLFSSNVTLVRYAPAIALFNARPNSMFWLSNCKNIIVQLVQGNFVGEGRMLFIDNVISEARAVATFASFFVRSSARAIALVGAISFLARAISLFRHPFDTSSRNVVIFMFQAMCCLIEMWTSVSSLVPSTVCISRLCIGNQACRCRVVVVVGAILFA